MLKPLMRIPYTGALPPPTIIPRDANTIEGAVKALEKFFTAPPAVTLSSVRGDPWSTVILSGAGISVASGLADYRGANGTYKLNKTYRPIYYHEFLSSHEARKRYWARSFLGWTNLHKASPNATHFAVRDLAHMGLVRSVVTQNVDSFHTIAHPEIETVELHGFLRELVCLTCRRGLPRESFQVSLARLNPAWAEFLLEAIASGALSTENPKERKARGMKTNPDGDVDLPGAPYSTFRYPACPHCLENPPVTLQGEQTKVEVDDEGAWMSSSTAGVLKPAVVMFGESIASSVKDAAERAVDESGRLLVLGTSLATYSAWRLARRARDRGMPIAILNLGGVRGEDAFFEKLPANQRGETGVRVEMATDTILPALVKQLHSTDCCSTTTDLPGSMSGSVSSGVFKDMLS